MARQIQDGVVETSTSVATGDFTLAGAVLGYVAFSAVCAVSDVVYYLIEAVDVNGDRTGAWETGSGTYSAANTLTRTTVHASSNAGAAVNFAAGTKRVSLSLTAAQVRARGALTYKSVDQTVANFTVAAALTFDIDEYDTDAIHDIVTNTSRLTVPAGVTKVRLSAHVRVELLTASNFVGLYIYKNGSVTYVGQAGSVNFSNQTVMEVQLVSPVLAVVAGDYFEAFLEIGVDTSVTVKGTRTWFSMRIIE